VTELGELGSEALRVLDLAPCGLVCTQRDGTFVRANLIFCNWVGYGQDELVGKKKFQNLLTVGGRIFHQTHWAPLLSMQGSISEVKLELVQRDGTALPIVINAIVRHEGEAVVHELAAFVARDRDKYERELVLSRKRLEEMVAETQRLHDDAKSRALFAEQMVGIVSHDLRNPISTVRTAAAILARGVASAGHDRLLARIARASDRADRLIGDLLDFTQARLGRGIAVNPEPIDLHALVAEAVEELALAHPNRNLRHVQSGQGECSADPNRLEQLIGNLVSNAVNYGLPAAPITVTSVIDERHFQIVVHNFGPVIASEVLPDLFEPMQRGEAAGQAKRSVGLGLFIVDQLVKAHGGKTDVQSSADAGTTFRMTFPRTADQARCLEQG
jgi:sigma-B regulation protein RsbU (phosphoserine phosphatase)